MTTLIQIAARIAADALLAANPAAPFDRRPLRQKAQALIDDWEANGLPNGAWKLTKAKVIARMRRLVDLPHTLNQGTLDSCAYICILYACLLRYPDQTVAAARDLYERGQASLGGLQLQPNSSLLAATEEQIIADDEAARTARREAEHFVPPALDPTDWMLEVALIDSIIKKPNFTGLGSSKNVMGISFSPQWRDAISQLSEFFPDADLSTASDVHDNFDTLFNTQLVPPNPQVEIFLWVNQGVFRYASASFTGLHAVVLHGRAQGSKGQEVDLAVYSYGGLEVLTVDYDELHSKMQALVAVTVH
jgi:hypothetical protein